VSLSTRARNVLQHLLSPRTEWSPSDPFVATSLTDAELLRRVSKLRPPVTYVRLLLEPWCGLKTSKELCLALGLPMLPKGKAQCPQCGHVFGGGK
jgi:hypothetical protein